MAFIYAMSDMHGEMEAFRRALSVIDLENSDNMLILCGDYMPPPDTDTAMVEAIMQLQEERPRQVVALCGNHELHYIDDHEAVCRGVDPALDWMRGLPFYYETATQIFVHAGIDEEAGDLWRWGTEDAYFCEKFPWSTGKFLKDIIAGHVGTRVIADDPDFHEVYWDGENHYYLDGTVHVSHSIPVLKYDTEHRRYTAFAFDENGNPEEYELEPPTKFAPYGAYACPQVP